MIWFVVIDPSGEILRIGQCHPEDLSLQGETVLTFTTDPAVTDTTHHWDGQQFLLKR
jgi:hypothetical protein